jgi:hypothetical protein
MSLTSYRAAPPRVNLWCEWRVGNGEWTGNELAITRYSQFAIRMAHAIALS